MKIKKTHIFILLIICLILSFISFILIKMPSKGTIANIYKDGVCIKSIDLSKVTSYKYGCKNTNSKAKRDCFIFN